MIPVGLIVFVAGMNGCGGGVSGGVVTLFTLGNVGGTVSSSVSTVDCVFVIVLNVPRPP